MEFDGEHVPAGATPYTAAPAPSLAQVLEAMHAPTLIAALALPLLGACSSAKETPKPDVHAATPANATTKVETPAVAQETGVAVQPREPEASPAMSIHSLKVESLDGGPVELARYAGDVLLVVNVASECGYTPQYAGLEALEQELSPKGFHVLGFPSNDFGKQEPGDPAQIRQFCTEKYHVTFPMFAKVATKAGPGQSPVYACLQQATGELPAWNFAKYLIGRDGKPIAFYASKVKPDDAQLRAEIEKALAASR